MKNYEDVYETLDDDGVSYIKVFNLSAKILANQVREGVVGLVEEKANANSSRRRRCRTANARRFHRCRYSEG